MTGKEPVSTDVDLIKRSKVNEGEGKLMGSVEAARRVACVPEEKKNERRLDQLLQHCVHEREGVGQGSNGST